MLDLLIKGATVVDGTGATARKADIGIRDGRIANSDEPAKRTIDASGLVATPGFVDIHTHYDAQLFWDPMATPSPLHGVTTVIGGNCGFTLAPASEDTADYLMRLMARVEGMPLAALEAGLDWRWKSYGDWLDRLDGRLGVNAGFLAGHCAIRRAVMGAAATDSEASPKQIAAMRGVLAGALAAGSLGFSTSQSPTHNDGDGSPVPSRQATRAELIALAAAVGDHAGTTLEAIFPGCLNGFTEDEVDLMAELSIAAGRPLNWNVLGVSAAQRQSLEHQLDASTQAEKQGARVVALTLPHEMRIRLSFLTGFVLDGLPGWRETFALPPAERMRALRDPEVRRRLGEGARSKEAGILRGLARWDRLEIAETFAAVNEGLTGLTVAEVAERRNRAGDDPFDVLLDVVIADGLRTGLHPATGSGNDDDWALRAEVWRDDRTIVGGSDAGAHLDMMCGAVYTTFMLGEAVRERKLLSIEEAVHQLTEVPARLYGLTGRGRLQEGWQADIVLFDPDTVGPGPVRTRDDLPGGASRLYAEAEGLPWVLVNGVEVVAGGSLTGNLPGTLLRSGRDTETVSVSGRPAA